jgi:hypothetical protein
MAAKQDTPHEKFMSWWSSRKVVSGPELRKLEAMSSIMGLSFSDWIESAFYAGMNTNG